MSKHRFAKKAEELSSYIKKAIEKNPDEGNKQIARILIKTHKWPYSVDYIRHVVAAYKQIAEERDEIVTKEIDTAQEKEKSGLELRDDYVINWTNKTIITDLGEYGNYVATFDKHGLIQRMYVYDDGNETAAIVAMEHDFSHTKAVYKYAKIHGFSKASPPQTDLEFELGKGVEESVEENIQTMKRSVYKKTQKRKWKEIVTASEKWWNLEHTLLEEIKALMFELKGRKIEKLNSIIPETDYKFASFIGMTDIHYLKLCYNHKGEITYDRKIARERMKEHTISLARETARYGKPEKFFVMVGCDNIHIDGMHQSTTKLTSQHQATDGLWRLELKNYFKLIIDQIEFYKQIAPVTAIPVKGNHDYETSIALQAMLELYYDEDPDVDIVICHDARAYVQYHQACFVVTHGDELGSINNLENQAHKLIMGEAKDQGINVMDVEYYLLLHGHEHVGSSRDLNGRVQRIGLPSMSDIDDFWHKEKGYVGRQPESLVVIVDRHLGRKALLYA